MHFLTFKIKLYLSVYASLTVNFAVQVVPGELHPQRAEAGGLGRPLGQLRSRQADVGAASVEGEAVVDGVRLAVGVVDMDHHGDLFLERNILCNFIFK